MAESVPVPCTIYIVGAWTTSGGALIVAPSLVLAVGISGRADAQQGKLARRGGTGGAVIARALGRGPSMAGSCPYGVANRGPAHGWRPLRCCILARDPDPGPGCNTVKASPGTAPSQKPRPRQRTESPSRLLRNELEYHTGRTPTAPLASQPAQPQFHPGPRPARSHDHARSVQRQIRNEREHHTGRTPTGTHRPIGQPTGTTTASPGPMPCHEPRPRQKCSAPDPQRT